MAEVILYDFTGSICSQMARLALVEKTVAFTRHPIDIMQKREQFSPWYMALNPAAVVPTLQVDGEVTTNTIAIVKKVDAGFDGPALSPDDPKEMHALLEDIMGLHYGVLLYAPGIDAAGRSPTIVNRGEILSAQIKARGDPSGILHKRWQSNQKFQQILKDPASVRLHFEAAEGLVVRLNTCLADHALVAGDSYSLADSFATAALARFAKLGYSHWWQKGKNPHVAKYYAAMKARPSWREALIDDGI